MSDSQSNTAQLEARIAQLTDELKSTKDEVVVLRSAFAHLSSRLEAVESSKPAPSSARPKTAAPTPTKPAPEPKETKENGDAEKVVKRPMTSPAKKYPTLPKGTVITPVKKEAEPKKASDDSEVKKTPSKVLQARIPGSASKDRIVEEQEDIDPSRKGFYQVGKARVYYLLPEEYAGADEKKKAAVEPPTDLKLEFAYGYNGKAARHNLFFAKNKNDYVYSLAGTGVIYNPTDNTQKFMTAHSEDILCLAVHPTRDIVATGQLDPKGAGTPYILIWDSATAEVLRKILFHDKGIIAVAFSPDGKYLLSVGDDDNHTVAIWDWETAGTKGASAIPTGPKNKKENEKEMATPLLEQNLSKDKIFAVSFNPRPNAAAEEAEDGKESKAEAGELEFVTLGPKHLKIWSVSGIDNKDKKARKLVGRTPSTREKTGKVQAAFLSVAFAPNGEYFVGTQSGNIFRMKGVNLVKVYDAHAKPADKQTEKEKDNEVLVGGIVRLNDGFASVADDGKVKLWDNDFKEIGEIDLSAHGTVRPKAMDFNGTDKIVIGTRNNTILEVNLETKQSAVRMEGHSDEVWALTVHPTDPIFVSGAHDKHLRFWNFQEHKVVEGKSVKLADKVRSAVFTPDGKHLVVGQNSGKAALYTYPALTQEWDKKIALETVDALAVSPDSSHVALGSWDQMIYIVSLPSGKIVHTLKGHTSSILMVNFSHDGKALMSNSRDYEILYWDVTKGKRITKQSEIADLKWSAWNCFLGWPVQGIWEGAGDGTDINAVDRSHGEAALATGDDFGRVRLYKYPAMQKDAPSKAYYGHSSHVTSVRFSPDDSKLFSAGGNDMALFQWRHEAAGAAGDQ